MSMCIFNDKNDGNNFSEDLLHNLALVSIEIIFGQRMVICCLASGCCPVSSKINYFNC